MDFDTADFSVEYLRKLGANYAEARLEQTKSNSVLLKNGKAEASSFEESYGLGIRFLVNGCMGFFSTNKLDKKELKENIDKSLRRTRNSGKIKEIIKLSEEDIYKDKYEIKQKEKFEDVNYGERLRFLNDVYDEMIEAGLKQGFLQMNDNVIEEYIINSDGTKIKVKVPKVSLFYNLNVEYNGKASQKFWEFGGCGGFEVVRNWKVKEKLVEDVKGMNYSLKKGIKLKKGKMDVVCGPEVVGIMIHEGIGHSHEADRILGREAAQAGESFVKKGMIGNKLGSEIVNIVDDPTVEGSYGFFKYDNEGVKARRKYLVKDGKINEFLHNRETAAAMGIKSNGSSRATDYSKETIVRMSNTFLLNGNYDDKDLFEGIKKGVFIKNFTEWNIDDRRLNQKYVGCEAYLIENNKLTNKPVLQPTIEITTPELWKSVDAIGKKAEYHAANCGKGEPQQAIPVWFGGPSLRLRNIWVY